MKRGQSGLSCLLAIDKPVGSSSHDMVNIARHSLGERRVGHAGTLDPFASGVLLLMAGPAARLDKYLTGHDKDYIATIVFGSSTTTDDCTGETLATMQPSSKLLDRGFATSILEEFLGESMQLPPVYSAIKIDGKKSYDEARHGNIVKLDPRKINVFRAELLDIGKVDESFASETSKAAQASIRKQSADGSLFADYVGLPYWKVEFRVSKGTYIRSLARDIGIKADCPSHLAALRRTKSGNVDLTECATETMLERDWKRACIDPVHALGLKVVFAESKQAQDVDCGRAFQPFSDQVLCIAHGRSGCECLPPLMRCERPLYDGELVSVVCDNTLKAIYAYDAGSGVLKPDCVFNIGVSRGIVA